MRPVPVIRGVLFDAEGVVIDTESCWDESQKQFLARRDIPYDRAQLKPLLSGRTLAEGCAVMQNMYRYPGSVAAHVEERRALMRDLVSRHTPFMTGFEAFFAAIRTRYRVALATAMDVELFELVDRQLGLRQLFDGMVVTLPDVEFKSKPNPDLFLCAAERLRLPPKSCAVIEDAPLGIKAALNAGMFAIGIATTYDARLLTDAHLTCSSFEEIRDAFEADSAERA